jgi:hypothetical protein
MITLVDHLCIKTNATACCFFCQCEFYGHCFPDVRKNTNADVIFGRQLMFIL